MNGNQQIHYESPHWYQCLFHTNFFLISYGNTVLERPMDAISSLPKYCLQVWYFGGTSASKKYMSPMNLMRLGSLILSWSQGWINTLLLTLPFSQSLRRLSLNAVSHSLTCQSVKGFIISHLKAFPNSRCSSAERVLLGYQFPILRHLKV